MKRIATTNAAGPKARHKPAQGNALGSRPGYGTSPKRATQRPVSAGVPPFQGSFLFSPIPRAMPHDHLVKEDCTVRRWMASLRAPCVARAEGPSFRVALSRGVWHGARSDAIHRHPLLAFTPKLNGRGATPWAGLCQAVGLRTASSPPATSAAFAPLRLCVKSDTGLPRMPRTGFFFVSNRA